LNDAEIMSLIAKSDTKIFYFAANKTSLALVDKMIADLGYRYWQGSVIKGLPRRVCQYNRG